MGAIIICPLSRKAWASNILSRVGVIKISTWLQFGFHIDFAAISGINSFRKYTEFQVVFHTTKRLELFLDIEYKFIGIKSENIEDILPTFHFLLSTVIILTIYNSNPIKLAYQSSEIWSTILIEYWIKMEVFEALW